MEKEASSDQSQSQDCTKKDGNDSGERVTAKFVPIPAATWMCPSCGEKTVTPEPRILNALTKSQEVSHKCTCGADMWLQLSLIEQIKNAKIRRLANGG